MSTSTSPFSQSFSCRPSFPSTPKLKYITHSSLHRTACLSSFSSSSSSRPLKNNWRFSCFKDENLDYDGIPETAGDTVDQEPNQLDVKHHWPLKLRKAVDVIFSAEPWTVPWTAKTVIQISQLKVKTSARMNTNFGNASLDCFILAFYSLLADVAERAAGIAILHRCLTPFCPLSPEWFKFSFKGKWLIDVCLGCLMFPLVNCLSQVNLNLLPMLPPAHIAASNVEHSIVARDPVAMPLYATVVSVCAPIWEEIVFRGFLLPSLTRYMALWCSILVSSLAFALAHFNMRRMLPLVFLGMVMGTVYTRSRNLLPSILLHSLWNAFVFIDLMK
ncbi:hypothetical protein R6Q57_027495 [Mikania cordata]